jgi:peroxiredoxin
MPGFENLYRRFRSEGLTILAVSLDKKNDKAVKKFAEDYNLSFPILIDEKAKWKRCTKPLPFQPPMLSIEPVEWFSK